MLITCARVGYSPDHEWSYLKRDPRIVGGGSLGRKHTLDVLRYSPVFS